MVIYKNNNSNKYFIYIQTTGDEEALLVTPDAQVKSLKLNLFTKVIGEQEESSLLQLKLVSEAQVKRFHEFQKDRSDEVVDLLEHQFEQLSHYQREELLKKLQKMI